MFIYQKFSAVSLGFNMFLLIIVGLLVNGPYALITTAVSAELGTHSSLEGNSKALATVTAIIDGTGSIGDFFIFLHNKYLFRYVQVLPWGPYWPVSYPVMVGTTFF